MIKGNLDWIKKFIQEKRPTPSELQKVLQTKLRIDGAVVINYLIMCGYIDKKLRWIN